MTYATEIGERQAKPWAELFQFTVGAVVNRYTSHDEAITFDFEDYTARTIERQNFQQVQELRAERLKMRVPLDEVMIRYVTNAPVELVEVVVTRVILDTAGVPTGDSYQLFRGELIDVSVTGNAADATFESDTEIFKNEWPNFVYQSRCQWMVFDEGCTLSEAAFKLAGPVTILAGGTQLQAAAYAGQPDGWLTLGHARFDNEIRLITKHLGDTITIQAPFDTRLQAGNTVTAFAGCDKSRDTCTNKFNNFTNFTGFANIPSRNPVIWGLEA